MSSRREFLITSAALCAAGCRRSQPARALAIEPLIDSIGAGDADRIPGLVADARSRGVVREQLLGAAWLAALRWGIPTGLHAVLVLPAIARLGRATRDDDAWRAVAWALGNVNSWRGPARKEPPQRPARTSPEWLAAAMQGSDEGAARAHAFALAQDLGTAATLALLCREAAEPRDDPHAAIYAAQVARGVDLVTERHHPLVLADLAGVLARTRRWPHFDEVIHAGDGAAADHDKDLASETAWLLCADAHAALDGLPVQTLLDALALLAQETRAQDLTIGGDVHATTHLDAMALLHQRAAKAEQPRVLASCVRANLRRRARTGAPQLAPAAMQDSGDDTAAAVLSEADPVLLLARAEAMARRDLPSYRREVGRRMARSGADEHGFKYWGAVDALSDLLSAPARASVERTRPALRGPQAACGYGTRLTSGSRAPRACSSMR